MGFGGRAIDALNVRGVENHKVLQDPAPDPGFRPTIEPIVDGRVRTVVRWAILPTAPDLQDVDDPTDYLMVPTWRHPTPFLRDRGLNRHELLIS